MTHREKARDFFLAGANCSQAVYAAFSDLTGIDESTSFKIAGAFGGGVARQRQICGAVSGMTLVLGTLYGYGDIGDQKKKGVLYAFEQELCRTFQARHGSLSCGELLRPHLDVVGTTPMPDARTAEYYRKRPCLLLVEEAAELMDAFIATHPR